MATALTSTFPGSPALEWPGLPALLSVLDRPVGAQEAPEAAVDAEDIRASLGGDGDAFERIVRRHQGRVAGWMRRFARDRGEMEELVQDVFVEAYVSLTLFRGQAPFGHWLRKIAVRTGYRHWKDLARGRRQVPLEDASLPAAGLPDMTPAQAGELMERLLSSLSPPDRLVVTLLHLEQLSVAEAARLTGWTGPVIKVRAFRARRKLATLAQRLIGEEVQP